MPILNRKLFFAIIILAIVFAVGYFFSTRISKTVEQNGRIRIVTSFYPLSYIANAVGGNIVSVQNLVSLGAEPHDFEPTPRDFINIGEADILIYNGASFEPWVKKWTEGSFERPQQIINMAEALEESKVTLLKKNNATDPHFWLDPLIVRKEVEIVRDVLTQIDPAHRDILVNNAERLISDLDILDRNFREGLAVCSLRETIVLHEAFSYLARQYKFKVTGIAGISPDEEPSPKELARIITLVREKGVKYIFSETVASPKFSELIARETGGTTLVLNPIESLTPDEVQWGEDYISIMRKNLNNLRKAMVCN